jgi:DNA helicase TIP49 (TBP-interacting protein)
LDFVAGKENVIFLGPPGTGKTHLAIGLGDPGLPSRIPGAVRHR